ncbi:MAG: hypothetical protein COA47_11495 [Robiginitomaculum sp.]|nr:MAG: hypothetical protein COA47_11495 [Robiginitomaculum sp.]
MSKYENLEQYLSNLVTDEWRVNFASIEKLLKFELPPSARKYPAWWSNDAKTHSQTRAWLNAGWRTGNLDIRGEKVTFRRKHRTQEAGQFSEQETSWHSKPTPKKQTGDIVVLQGISEEALRVLRRRASASQHTLEQEIINLIHRDTAENNRMTQIRAIRAKMPSITDVDIVQVIREGRNER